LATAPLDFFGIDKETPERAEDKGKDDNNNNNANIVIHERAIASKRGEII
jgi:hypothetical protein